MSKKTPKADPPRKDKIHSTKAGRTFDNIMREVDRNRQDQAKGKEG